MKKLSILFLLLLTATKTYALEMYSCPNEYSVSSCSNCKKANMKITFKVNVENQIVIKKINNGYNTSVFSIKGCAVADKENWVCTDYWSNGNRSNAHTMSNNVYSEIWYNFYGPAITFTCAK